MAQYSIQMPYIYDVAFCVRPYNQSFSHLCPCLLDCEAQSVVVFVHFKNENQWDCGFLLGVRRLARCL